ncbi:MAG: tetratricopeptide repeat protein [Nitrospira sp.]|nr:tetratricopeptide repeat protein [Nitrospira sp.]
MLSLCMIARDEEEFISTAISSVSEIADDIVVVDTGSTDSTVEIARKFNARVFPFKWNKDFSEAKNFSISKAIGDWILVLDADEIISKRDIYTLLALTKGGDYFGYSLIQRTYCEKSNLVGWVPNPMDYEEGEVFSGFHPSSLVRLFRNDHRIRFTGKIHELVEVSMLDYGLRFQDTAIPIHHFGMTRGEGHFRNKLIQYAELEETRAREDLKKIDLLVRAATIYREMGLFKKAGLLLDEVIATKPYCGDAYHELAVLSEKTGDYIKTEEFYLKALVCDRANPVIQYNYGNYLSKKGRNKEAVKYLLKVISAKPEHFNAHYILAEIFFKTGEFHKSLTHFREVIRIYPANSKARHNLGVVYYTMGNKQEASEEFSEAIRINPEYAAPRFYLGLIYAECGWIENARKEIEISLIYDPDNTEARRVLELI